MGRRRAELKSPVPDDASELGDLGARWWSHYNAVDEAGKPKYLFSPPEQATLLMLCDAWDKVGWMQRELTKHGSLMARGAQGADIAHPLLGELRLWYGTIAALQKQLNLPDERAAGEPKSLRDHQRAAGKARWSKPSAVGG